MLATPKKICGSGECRVDPYKIYIHISIPRTGLSPFLPIHPLLRVSLHLATHNTVLLPKYGYYAFLCFFMFSMYGLVFFDK
jgi:hypothetical protein